MKLSIAIPYHDDRCCFLNTLLLSIAEDEHVSEIVVNDDGSKAEDFEKLIKITSAFSNVYVYRNEANLGAFHNKYKTVSLCKEEVVVLIDSDNLITPSYLSTVCSLDLKRDSIYCPTKFTPFFDFEEYVGKVFCSDNVKENLESKLITFFNMGNYAFYKETYLSCLSGGYQSSFNPLAMDVAYANSFLLAMGIKFIPVENLCVYIKKHRGHISFKDVKKNSRIRMDITNQWGDKNFSEFMDKAWPELMLESTKDFQ